MAWDPIVDAELIPGNPILKHMKQAWNCLKWLYGQIGTLSSSAVLNGSFEVDSNADGQPDNWTLNTYPGGSGSIDTATPAHGSSCVKLIHPGGAGNGGGYYESDYVVCSNLVRQFISFIHWATAAGMKNQLIIRYYDKAKVYISQEIAYSSTANPTTATWFVCSFFPPDGARYYKMQLVGGSSDTNVAGTAFFDAVQPAGLDMFLTRPFNGAIAEASTADGGYADIGSFTVPIPYCNMPISLTLTAEFSVTSAEPGFMRFRSGAVYSPAFSTSAGNPITVTAGISFLTDTSGWIQVFMQAASGAGGYDATGSVTGGTYMKVNL